VILEVGRNTAEERAVSGLSWNPEVMSLKFVSRARLGTTEIHKCEI
jgi:hypothetical protein